MLNSRVFYGNAETRLAVDISAAPMLETLLTAAPQQWVQLAAIGMQPMSDDEGEGELDEEESLARAVEASMDVLAQLAAAGLPVVLKRAIRKMRSSASAAAASS